MIIGLQHTVGLGDAVSPQRRRCAQHHVDAEAGSDGDTDSQFLAQFARQRSFVGLAGSHLSAGQLPQARQLRRSNSLRGQKRTVVDQRAGDHDLV